MTPEEHARLEAIHADTQELRLCLQLLTEEHFLMFALLQTFVSAPDELHACGPDEMNAKLRQQRAAVQAAITAMLQTRRQHPPTSPPAHSPN